MENLEIKHTDFVEEVLTGDYYAYYVVCYRPYANENDKVAFIGIDMSRAIYDDRKNILLSEYRKVENTYINTNILFNDSPPFQVQHIKPKDVRMWFKVVNKANDLIRECIGKEIDIYSAIERYKEILK